MGGGEGVFTSETHLDSALSEEMLISPVGVSSATLRYPQQESIILVPFVIHLIAVFLLLQPHFLVGFETSRP